MAAKEPEKVLNINTELRKLKTDGPDTLYLLYGPEDYLKEVFLTALKNACLQDGSDDFNYKRINGPELDRNGLEEAVNSMPFLGDRIFIEIRNVDVNHLKESDKIAGILSDIPDCCTVAFFMDEEYEPDGRLKITKLIKSHSALKFTEQPQGKLIDWIQRRFEAGGKSIDMDAARRLMFLCGNQMSKLIPEIEKIAAFSGEEKITLKDVNAIAVPIPDAVVFDLIDNIADKRLNNAFDILADLLEDEDNEPIAMIALLGMQFRRLYAAKLAALYGRGSHFLIDSGYAKGDYQAKISMRQAEKFSISQLQTAVEGCAEADFLCKSSGNDSRLVMQDLILSFLYS